VRCSGLKVQPGKGVTFWQIVGGICKVSDLIIAQSPKKKKQQQQNLQAKINDKNHLFRCHHDATVKVIMEITNESCIKKTKSTIFGEKIRKMHL